MNPPFGAPGVHISRADPPLPHPPSQRITTWPAFSILFTVYLDGYRTPVLPVFLPVAPKVVQPITAKYSLSAN